MQPEPGTKTHDLLALMGIIIFIISVVMWWKGLLLLIVGTITCGLAQYFYIQHKKEIVRAFNEGRDSMGGDLDD